MARTWFRAEGIPITPYDDAGRKNPYPLMRLVRRLHIFGSSGSVRVTVVTLANAVDGVMRAQTFRHVTARAAQSWIVSRASRSSNDDGCAAATDVAEIAFGIHAGRGPMHLVVLAARKHCAFR